MPTDEEKQKRGLLSGFWSGVQRDLNYAKNAPFGQMVGAGLNATSRTAAKFNRIASTGVGAFGEFFGGPNDVLAQAGKTAEKYWAEQSESPDQRKKRLAQSMDRPAPVQTRNIGPTTPGYDVYSGKTAEEAATTPGKAMTEPRLKGEKTSSTQTTQRTSATRPAPSQDIDVRRRYLEMAGVNFEDPEARQKMFAKIPEGERPIEVLRGNDMTFWDPKTKQEYRTPQEAIQGVPGVPTMEKEMERETELGKARINAEAVIKSSEIRANAVKYAANLGNAQAGSTEKGDWGFEFADDGSIVRYDKNSPATQQKNIGTPEKNAALIEDYWRSQTDEGVQKALDIINAFSPDVRKEVMRNLSPGVRTSMLDIIEEAVKQKKAKRK